MYHVRITDPTTGRVYTHGMEYPGNTSPMNWPTRRLAQIVVDCVTAAGKLAEIVEVPDAPAEPKPDALPSPARKPAEPSLFPDVAA